ncbi:Calcium-transporting ATPase 1 [Symmachiella macrocystis]|uniref:Calcium-transporting ATPase 1 n=1 Tax=Symmachiella macrocystis TaxID=2527985 RepID=A0A5C6BMM4_9PLAN|nr:cation-transporting P-type ATPase [Symmachiella macrocystis]TWU12536.1 Calcium-transporting ATPase 1 [Symmachiella macrocystis]
MQKQIPTEIATKTAWHALSSAEVISQLGTDLKSGLSATESQARLKSYGPNELLSTEETRWYTVLLRQFWDVIIGILMLAALMSAATGELIDAAAILIIVVLNGLLGFVQEWKAEQALKALQQMLAPQCTVVRDGRELKIQAAQIVPGDLVMLRVGNRVPADLRLTTAVNLKVDESALTGESDSVSKGMEPVDESTPLAEKSSMVWMGTAVTNGHASGIVVATGEATEFGRVALLTQAIGPETTPLQRRTTVLGKKLGLIAIVVSALIAVGGWVAGKPRLEMFLTGVSLAVAVVPEGLPAVITITLALGVRAMAKKQALLRRLTAAEALGAASVVCTDKTGTLTKNEMTVQQIWLPSGHIDVTGTGYDPAGHFEVDGERLDYQSRPDLLAFLETGLRCNHSTLQQTDDGWQQSGEPTEAALVVAAYKAWMPSVENGEDSTEFSFNSTRKRMTVVERKSEGALAHVKGAPEVILGRCQRILKDNDEQPLTEDDRQRIEHAYAEMANEGLRVLAIARRTLPLDFEVEEDAVEQDLTLLGLAGIIDPPRPEVSAAIETAALAGIHVIMITGDAAPTALAIAKQIGLSAEQALTGSELKQLDDATLLERLMQKIVIARATPEQKLRIVTLLQGNGHVVAMTGDGVNDAPALKKAEIGIAMGLRGTDVAKGAADMVLTDDNFSSIINAVEEGRRQYDNIQKFVLYLLSSNTGEVLAIFCNILLGGPLILLPVQILWMNLITDGVTAVALGLEPIEEGNMHRPPRDSNQPLLDRRGIVMIGLLGSYLTAVTLWLMYDYWGSDDPHDKAIAQTMAFCGLIIAEKINVFNFRTLRTSLFRLNFFSNPWILIACTGMIGLQVAAVYIPFLQTALHTMPLGLQDWGLIVALSLPVLVIGETYKWFLRRGDCEVAHD